LIDSVLNDLPIGLVMLNVIPFTEEGKTLEKFDVVDGQQRITTLISYRDATETWSTKGIRSRPEIHPYTKLSQPSQERFDLYKVSLALMRDYEENEILDSFSRLQKGKPLKIGEKIKALPTDFKPQLKTLVEHKIFKLANSAHKWRDGHWNLSSAFFKSVYINKPRDRQEYTHLESFLKKEKYNQKKALKALEKTKKFLNYEVKVLDEATKKDGTFEKRLSSARLLKWLFVALELLLDRFSLTGREHKVAEGILAYYRAVDKEQSDEWAAYLNTGRSGRVDTDDVGRCLEHLMNYIINASVAQPLDTKRFFTADQRKQIYEKSGGKCQKCGTDLSPTNFHADHITPFTQAGKTETGNGQALCSKCNWEKGGTPELFK